MHENSTYVVQRRKNRQSKSRSPNTGNDQTKAIHILNQPPIPKPGEARVQKFTPTLHISPDARCALLEFSVDANASTCAQKTGLTPSTLHELYSARIRARLCLLRLHAPASTKIVVSAHPETTRVPSGCAMQEAVSGWKRIRHAYSLRRVYGVTFRSRRRCTDARHKTDIESG